MDNLKEREKILDLTREKVIEKFKVHKPRTEMSKAVTELFITLVVMASERGHYEEVPMVFDKHKIDKVEDEDLREAMLEVMSHLGSNIVGQRVMISGLKITPLAALFAGSVIKSPGEAVMVANYICYKYQDSNVPVPGMVTLNWVATEVFPFGVFSDEQLSDIWDTQKVPFRPDNYLDYAKAWEWGFQKSS